MKNKSFYRMGMSVAIALTFMLLGGVHAAMMPGFQAASPMPSAPAFSLSNLSGQPSTLQDHRGKVVLLKFWEAYCPYCVEEFKSMEALASKFNGKLVVLAVSSGSQKPVIQKLIRAQGLKTIQFYQAPSRQVKQHFNVLSVPTTYIINKSGKIVGVVDRSADWGSLGVSTFIERLTTEAELR